MASTSEKNTGPASGPGPGPGGDDAGADHHLTLPTTNNPYHSQGQDKAQPKTGLRIRDWVRSPRSGEARHSAGHDDGAGAGAGGRNPTEPEQEPKSRRGGNPGSDQWWKIHLFRGMVNDVRKRAPYYLSDWTDAWNYRVVPATVYMFFAK